MAAGSAIVHQRRRSMRPCPTSTVACSSWILVRQPRRPRRGKQGLDILMQRALIACERPHVVGLLRHNRAGHLPLAAHGVTGHETALPRQHLPQGRQRRDRVRRRRDRDLAQPPPVGRRPGADQMQRSRAALAVMGAAPARAIDGDHLPRRLHRAGGHPGQKAALKLGRVQRREHPTEGVVRRNAVGQRQERAQPRPLRRAECRDRHPAVRAADHATERDRDDVEQLMAFGPLDTGSDQGGTRIVDTGTSGLVPGAPPRMPSRHAEAQYPPRSPARQVSRRCDCPRGRGG